MSQTVSADRQGHADQAVPPQGQRGAVARVVGAFRLEVWMMTSYYPVLAGLVVVGFVASVSAGSPTLVGGAVIPLSVMLVLLLYSVHEKSRTPLLYGFVPLRRREVVAGRYLYAMVVGLVAVVVGAGASTLAALVSGADFGLAAVVGPGVSGWLLLCFTVACTYPVYFVIDFSRAAFVAWIPMVLVVGGLGLAIPDDQDLSPALNLLMDHPVAVAGCGLGAGLVLLAVSALVATVLYQRKDLS